MSQHYSTNTISQVLVDEILQALKTVNSYGSVEIYVQNNIVTQITIRNIKKTFGASSPSEREGIKEPRMARRTDVS